MQLVTWNINGIRSFDDKWKETLEKLAADVICVQETKVTSKSNSFFPQPIFLFFLLVSGDLLHEPTALIEGYTSYFSCCRKRSGYSGVATYCKNAFMPIKAEEGLAGTLVSPKAEDSVGCYDGIEEQFSVEDQKALDAEGRCVITLHEIKIRGCEKEQKRTAAIINLYCPRADPEKPERKRFKLQFYKLLELRADALRKAGHWVIIVGDINTSHRQIDHCDPYEVMLQASY